MNWRHWLIKKLGGVLPPPPYVYRPLPNPRPAGELITEYKVKKFGNAIGDNRRAIDWQIAAVQMAQKWLAKVGQNGVTMEDKGTVPNVQAAAALRQCNDAILGYGARFEPPYVVILWQGQNAHGAQVIGRIGDEV